MPFQCFAAAPVGRMAEVAVDLGPAEDHANDQAGERCDTDEVSAPRARSRARAAASRAQQQARLLFLQCSHEFDHVDQLL